MFKLRYYAALLLVCFFSCQNNKTEKSELEFWKQRRIAVSDSFLYKDRDTTRALRYFDSLTKRSPGNSAYLRAYRFDLKANYYYFFTNDNLATAEMIDSALASFNSSGMQNWYPRTYVGLLLFGGQIAYRLNEFGKANEYYFRAKTLGEAFLTPCEQTPFYYSMAMVLYRQQNFAGSLNCFTKAYALQQTCAPQTTAVVLQQQEIQDNIGLCYVQLKNDDSAMVHFTKALEIAERNKDSLGPVAMDKIYGVVYGNRAKVLMDKKRLNEAETLSLKSIALNDRKGYEEEFAQAIKLQLANIYSRKNELASMFAVLEGMEKSLSVASQRLEWQRLMAAYYEQKGESDLSLQFLKKYLSLQDSITTAQKLLTSADVTRQLRDKEQEMQIAVLKKDNEMTLTYLFITLALSCMALLIIYLIYLNYRRSKKNMVKLKALNEEIKKQKVAREQEMRQRHKLITEAVIRAQENERSLIGLELHDNINQVLTTVKLHNEMLLDGVGEPHIILPRTVRYLQDCITEIRNLSKRLSAPTLGKISLEESIRDLIRSVNETNKVKVTYTFNGLKDKILNRDIHIGLYRILQEQLQNVLKHSNASEVLVHIEHQKETVRLLISDNGKGFQVNDNKKGIGLVNMQTRAESLNGTFELNSRIGKGCTIQVILPCLQ